MGGSSVNLAIARYATVRVERFPAETSDPAARSNTTIHVVRSMDHALVSAAVRRIGVANLSISLHSDFPLAAGLGGSSAAGVATVAALAEWQRMVMEREQIAELSRDIETTEMGIAGGRQDHYAAAFGGALALRFAKTVECTRIPLTAQVRSELARRCLIIYTGQSRVSGTTITAVLGAYRGGDRKVTFALQQMRALAERMPAALEEGRLDDLGALVGEQWAHQRTLDPAIPTPLIDAIIERARHAGACGAKALGASGGGCVLVVARASNVEAVRAAIAPMGELIDYAVDEGGVTRCD